MSPVIRVLDPILADQIAAGEVVERPSSVVKELLENAMDAGATEIRVAIEDGGQRLIRITDNGSGMGRQDAALCVVRHATSKLRTQDDLFSIGTLGFRGEALPSIASVSRLQITTRLSHEAEGTRVEVSGGEPAVIAPAGCASGTTVEVRDLFFNVPARLKFLKNTATESGHVSGVCTRLALAHPQVRLILERDGRKAKEFLPKSRFEDRVKDLFPGETFTVHSLSFEGMNATAVLGAPDRARSGASALHLFVNGRPVKDIGLARAVAFAYGSVLPPGRFPTGAVDLRLSPAEVDVNVHPQKSEVRFRDGRARLESLTRGLAQELGTSAFRGPANRPKDYWDQRLPAGPRIADAATSTSDLFSAHPRPLRANESLRAEPVHPTSTTQARSEMPAQLHQPDKPLAGDVALPPALALDHQPQAITGFFAGLRVLGQVRRMLLVCEGHDGLYILDQHAADERVRYDRFRRAYAAGTVNTQHLLFPERVTCTESEIAQLEACHEQAQALGLEYRTLGPTTVAVHSVPALLHRASPEQLLRDLLAELCGHGERAFGDAIDMAIATMACHAAIRGGDVLSVEEAQALLRNLDTVQDFGGHCPHGRPIAHNLPFADLLRRLGR